VFLYDESAPSLNDVIRIARKWKHQHGIKALYVDYLQRISASGERRQEEVARVARGLKNLARSLNIPVIALAQVNRASEQASDKRPTMASLSDSSEIEKEADQVILIYREGYYNPEADQGIAELLIVKNRHGATGRARVAWVAEQMRFADLPSRDGGDW
jgi:replicative DNA helicase